MPRTYREGFADGFETGYSKGYRDGRGDERDAPQSIRKSRSRLRSSVDDTNPFRPRSKPNRKLSAWNKFVKNKRNHITYRDGKLNLKKMAVAFRRKQRR